MESSLICSTFTTSPNITCSDVLELATEWTFNEDLAEI